MPRRKEAERDVAPFVWSGGARCEVKQVGVIGG